MRHFLLTFPIRPEFNPNPDAGLAIHAPETSSTDEAVSQSYGVAEQHVIEAIESDLAGFRGGWLSTTRVSDILRDAGVKKSPRKISGMIENMGYSRRCRASRPLMHENMSKPQLYSLPEVTGSLDEYEKAQGYC